MPVVARHLCQSLSIEKSDWNSSGPVDLDADGKKHPLHDDTLATGDLHFLSSSRTSTLLVTKSPNE